MNTVMRRLSVRTWIITGAVVLALAGGATYWFGLRDAPGAAAQPESRSVAASLTTLEKSVTGTGTLTPAVQEDVSFTSAGTVTSVLVAAGDTVAAGQTLATIDTLSLDADVLAARATLAKAQATLAASEDDAAGTAASDAQIASDAKQVELAQSQVTAAEEKLAGATLTAPVDGILTTVDLEVGDVVGSSSSSGSSGAAGGAASAGGSGAGSGSGSGAATTATASAAAFTIVGTTSWTVAITVDESDVASLALGNQAELTVDTLSSTVFGTVTEIGLISTSTRGVAGYPVTITVTGNPEGLNDGVSADVSVIYERRSDVLTVPTAAVRLVDGASVVDQVAADGSQVATPVTVGETSGSTVEITAGLAEGDEVLVTTVQQSAGQSGQNSQRGQSGGTESGGFPGGEMPEGGFGGEMPSGGGGPGGQGGGNRG